MVEQDHRGIKRITKPMLGFKSFASAENILAGMEALLKPDFYPNFNKQSVDIIVL
jgi:transposase-like protein